MAVFKIKIHGKRSSCWYGKVKIGTGKRSRVKLFTDKTASERRLMELQRQADQRAAGVTTVESERLQRPIADLSKLYVESLRSQLRDVDHVRIVEWMNAKLIELGGWEFFQDINQDSMEKILATLDSQGKTASYRNKYIARAKAFVRWLLPEGAVDPLRKLRRVREKGAKRTRERRAAMTAELSALFNLDLPADRKLAYALAALNGLRRNEVARLTWDDLSLNATIPFIRVRRKQGHDDTPDCVPLHPYVQSLLAGRMAMPQAKVVSHVPDVATIEKDWEKAEVAFKDAHKRRLDYHALRHTFASALDQCGCSRATKKKLMRHANEDVTDGYTHAELAEMLTALHRLPSPLGWGLAVAVKTGTGVIIPTRGTQSNHVDHRVDQSTVFSGHSPSFCDTKPLDNVPACGVGEADYNGVSDNGLHPVSLAVAETNCNLLSEQYLRPSTQVD